jgi:hypothetical protein
MRFAKMVSVTIFLPAAAWAQVPLCLEVRAPAADLDGFRTLVRTELDRHPTHAVVEDDCRSLLHVALVETAGVRFLTAQIDQEVPVRFRVKDPADLGDRLTEAIKLALHNDPVYLAEDITHYSEVQRLGHSIGVRGRNTWRFEVFEAMSRGGSNVVFATGGAFAVTRGADHWQVLARLYLAGWPGRPAGMDRVLQVMTGADAGLAYEFLPRASWSPYLGACAGLQYLRYAGREGPTDATLSYINQFGVTVGARAGVRFFRFHDFDLDLFAQGYLPLFLTKDQDGALYGEKGLYTPALQMGLGVGF